MKNIKNFKALFIFMIILCTPFIFACGEGDVATVDPGDIAVTDKDDGDNGKNNETLNENLILPPEEIEPSAKLLGLDFETKGDWIGKYGSEGYIIPTADDSLENVPKYVKWDSSYPDFYLWWETGAGNTAAEREKSALLKGPDSKERIAACYYAGDDFTININVGKETKKISLYMNDFDAYKRAAKIKVYNKNGGELKEPVEVVSFAVGEYVGGCYLSYLITGEVQFEFVCAGDNTNVVLSGIFFDPGP